MQIFGYVEWCGDVVDCEMGVKSISVASCGERGCMCDRCQHKGFRCNGSGCNRAEQPNACEDFNLIFCLGGCLRASAKVSLKLIGRCLCGFERLRVSKVVDGSVEAQFVVPIKPGELLPGNWTAVLEIEFTNGRKRQEVRKFRVRECVDSIDLVDEFEPCDAEPNCQSGC